MENSLYCPSPRKLDKQTSTSHISLAHLYLKYDSSKKAPCGMKEARFKSTNCMIPFVWHSEKGNTIGKKGLPRWLRGQESACNAGDVGLIPGSGRSPGEGNGNPLQYTCMGNLMDRGIWLQSLGLQRVGRDFMTEHSPTHREENRSVVVMVEGGVEKVTWGIFGGGDRHNILNFGGSCKTVHVCQTSELFPLK